MSAAPLVVFVPGVKDKMELATDMVSSFSFIGLALIILVASPTKICGDAGADVRQTAEDFWKWKLEQEPEFATESGEHMYDDRLESFRYDVYEARKNKCEEFLARLNTVDDKSLNKADKLEYDLLKDHLQTYVDGFRWRNYGNLNPMSVMMDGFMRLGGGRLNYISFNTYESFTNYNKRLQSFPTQIDEQMDLMRRAIVHNTTLHMVSITPFITKVTSMISAEIENQPLYSPIIQYLNNESYTANISPENKTRLRTGATDAIRNITSKLTELKNFLETEYLPNTRTGYGVGSLPNGQAYYIDCLKWHLTIDESVQEIHKRGLDEVAKLKNKMEQIMKEVSFQGTLTEFFAHLRSQTQFYLSSAEEYLQRFRDIILQKVTPQIDKLFQDAPTFPLVVKPSESSGVAGFYSAATLDGKPGIFYASIVNYQARGTFDMIPLALHESNPGHHLQTSYQLDNTNLPAYRQYASFYRSYSVPFFFPPYVAYSEGWSVYAETLGLDMDGVYETEYDKFGLYSSLMLRACRVVVDTGIHGLGWSRDQAIEYMLNHTFSIRPVIEGEVDRYISWPAQAATYTIGKLKIEELRATAKEALGDAFDVREFHSVVLQNGRIPLDILESVVKEWIKESTPTPVPMVASQFTFSGALYLICACFYLKNLL